MVRRLFAEKNSRTAFGFVPVKRYVPRDQLTRRCSRRITLAFLPFEDRVCVKAMYMGGQASAPAAKRYVRRETI